MTTYKATGKLLDLPDRHPDRPYLVSHWGSMPGTNDDCWQSYDFASVKKAVQFYETDCPETDVLYILIDGPNIHEQRKNPRGVAFDSAAADEEWRREQQMEAGMLHGADAYNEWEGQ